MEVRRGDVVVAVLPGDYGKPRPAVVVQSDWLGDEHPSVVLCPMTSEPTDHLLRPVVEPNAENGLARRSFVMVDKITAVPRLRLGNRIGCLMPDDMTEIEARLIQLLDLPFPSPAISSPP